MRDRNWVILNPDLLRRQRRWELNAALRSDSARAAFEFWVQRNPSNELFDVSGNLDAALTFGRRERCDWILCSEIYLMGRSLPQEYIRHGSRVVSSNVWMDNAISICLVWFMIWTWSSSLFWWSWIHGTTTLPTGSQRQALQGSTCCCKLKT
jgi:hypothetical protein